MKTSAKVKSVIIGILAILLFVEAFDFLGGYDYIKSSTFTPSSEMSSIIEKLNLTARGERILRAVKPNQDSRDIFNEKCNSHKTEVYVLGCYLAGDDTIHLYAINQKELAGINESTTAHELLHAVYHRLPFWEKTNINDELKMAYDQINDEDLKSAMSLYNDAEFYDELHSRLGTEIKSLPENLEKYYAKIFKDRSSVVKFYNDYSGTFKKLSDDLKATENKLSELKTKIDSEEARLKQAAKDLNSKIDDYNKRVSEQKYDSIAAARTEGQNLQAEADNLNKEYDALSSSISEYNELVSEYNNSVIRTNQIFDSINSNSKTLETINK
jgi:DNA repair exonuclease SbcCD ATPase subunit